MNLKREAGDLRQRCPMHELVDAKLDSKMGWTVNLDMTLL